MNVVYFWPDDFHPEKMLDRVEVAFDVFCAADILDPEHPFKYEYASIECKSESGVVFCCQIKPYMVPNTTSMDVDEVRKRSIPKEERIALVRALAARKALREKQWKTLEEERNRELENMKKEKEESTIRHR